MDFQSWMTTAAVLVAVGLVLWIWIRGRSLRRWATRLKARLDEFLAERGQATAHGPKDPLGALASSIEACAELQRQTAERLEREIAMRELAQARLRESEERYALAVRGANDGMWEWDLAREAANFSPRWKAMLGYAESELGSGLEEWTSRIHPEERERVLRELEAHLEGRSERFETEHRLRHRDGSWRVVLARASAVRHASGKASRLVGLMTDISARKRVQEALIELAEGLSSVRGEACLRELVRAFAHVLGVREVFVCECTDSPATRVRMLARWKGGEFAHCLEFDLQGTACEEVIVNGSVVYVPQHAGERWPLEKQYERDAYLGLPCLDSEGRVIGHIACADPVSMPADLPHEAILKLFALRASVELERRRLTRPHTTPASLPAAQLH